MHLFVRLCDYGTSGSIVRRVILMEIVPLLVAHIYMTRAKLISGEHQKCTRDDPRSVYPYCMMHDGTLWCDQSSYTKMPSVEEINDRLVDKDCRTARVLYINDSCLTDIGDSDLREFGQVAVLNMEANQLKELHRSAFSSNKRLKSLDACKNQIRSIDREAFKGLHELTFLNLAHNEVHELTVGVFDHATNLEELCLDDNFLSTIQDNLMRRLTRLKILRLRGNLIVQIGRHAFYGLKSLTHLHLDGNRLEFVTISVFHQHLPHLEVLTLSHNRFFKWPAEYGKILVNLHTLDLGHNMISEFTSTHVLNMSKLQNLSLENNSLTNVDEDLFATTPRLGYLNLGHNYIEDIPKKTFAGLCYLKYLFLHKNQLKVARREWFEELGNKGSVDEADLGQNIWICGCESKEYWKFVLGMTSGRLRILMDIECNSPKKFRGIKLGDLPRDEFETCPRHHVTFTSTSLVTTAVAPNDEATDQTPNCTEQDFQVKPTPQPFRMSRREPRPDETGPRSDKHPTLLVVCIILGGVLALAMLLFGYVWVRRNPCGNKTKKETDHGTIKEIKTANHNRRDELVDSKSCK